MRPSCAPHVYRNRILSALSEEKLKRLTPHLRPEEFPARRVLYEIGQPVHTVYFMEEGICSTVVELLDGNVVEAGIVGYDGFIGLPAILRSGRAVNRAFIQVPGSGLSISASVLRRELTDSADGLAPVLLRAAHARLTQTSRTAACNRAHDLEERLARWLLMCRERLRDNRLSITHEFLAMMLGTGRPSLTVAAGTLQRAGLIQISRGYITILDRKRLEHTACECYPFVRDEYVRLGLL